ncbi:SusC/RagA family TonB-linked outer membrane protein [Salinimicrobium catena]|uniref:SusC/RagA family TonB-linked outer membrane protein n=1 Tax=Salinimicrobium catena TaxID=390640 RepID=UPI002FE4DCE1
MKNNYSRFVITALITIILFLFVMTVRGYGAEKEIYFQTTISGKVVDQEGLPIPGVAVNIKNSNKGTVTNLNGTYNIQAASNDILVFSYLGFKKQEVPVRGRSTINVTLQEDVTALDEVEINAGYYNTTRRESTGNISRVTAEEIEMQPVVSPLQALQGRMAGVEVTLGGDQPGMAPTIRIRGRNSLREEGNYPLYIIDGVPINSSPIESNSLLGTTGIDPLSTLDLSGIQSIEVLKDADATAIYGSRGANGVVLITTKQGKYKDRGLQVSTSTGVSWMPSRIDLLNTEEYLQLRRTAFENDGVEPTASNAPDLTVWDQERYTDWQDYAFGGTAEMQNINLSAVESMGNTTFRLGGSYQNVGTIYRADLDYNKITGSLNINHHSKDDKLFLGLAVNYGRDDISSVGDNSLSVEAFYLPPNTPQIFNEDGSLHWEEWGNAGMDNPFGGFFNESRTKSNNLISNLALSYNIVDGLNLKSSFGYTNFHNTELVKMPKRSYNPVDWENVTNTSHQIENDRETWIIEPQLHYNLQGKRFGFDALIGGTLQQSNYAISNITGEGYVAESLIGNLSAAKNITITDDSNTEYRYAAIFGRLGVDLDEKYFLNLTGRRDGSSRFGSGKKWADFGAIGAAWIFTEEDVFKNSNSFLSFGKIRASYGTTGSDQIGDYGYLDAYEATPGPGGLYPTQLANSDYSWEINKKLEAAIHLGFLQDRIGLGMSWYQNRSSNQLVGFSLPSTTGFTSITANLPATVENTGLEAELSFSPFQTKNFSWETFLNVTVPKNELIKYPGIENSVYANTYRVGHPLSIELLYRYEGLDPETGFYKVADVNEDGRYNYEDRTVIKSFDREFYGGLSNTLSYRGFSLQFLVSFAKQEGTLNLFNAGAFGNQRAEDYDALSQNTHFQKVSRSSQARTAYNRVLYTNFPVVDASYLRLKNLSLAYKLPSLMLSQVGLKNGKIFLNGQNLVTITRYEGMDPEFPKVGTYFSSLSSINAGFQLQF